MNLNHFYLIIFIQLSFLIIDLSAQSPSFKPVLFTKPTNCNSTTEYFDVSDLQCKKCPANSKPIDRKP